MWKGMSPLPREKCNRYAVSAQGRYKKDRWQTKEVLAIPGMECHSVQGIVDVGRIHLRTYREAPAHRAQPQGEDMSVPEMAPASL
jgi:hypothetical protein